MQASKFTTPLKFAVLSAALALCGAAQAAGTSADAGTPAQSASATAAQPAAHSQKHKMHKFERGHEGRHAAMWVPGYGPLNAKVVDSLALNDQQKKLLQDAQSADKAARQANRDTMKTAMKERLEQVKAGKMDPHAALTQSRQAHEQVQASREKLDNNWLAVWDALDAPQREKIASSLNERAEKFAKRAQERKQRHAQQDAAKVAS